MKKTLTLFWLKALPICLAVLSGFQMSCKDSVDESDIYTFTGQTAMDYITSDSTLSLFAKVVAKSKVSQNSQSYTDALLSARGHYTIFAPTDEAVTEYLDSIYASKVWNIDTMSQKVADVIIQNCIIDHGTLEALLTSDFPEAGAITQATLNDRHIMVSYGTDENGKFQVVLNSKSAIIKPDIEVTNGYIHVVNRVLSPSSSDLCALIGEAGNMHIFYWLLKETTWGDSIIKYRDEQYELYTEAEKRNDVAFTSSSYHTPPHRYYGYMAFAETDDVFENEWGITPIMNRDVMTNAAEIKAVIEQKCKEAYPNATSDDWTSMNNAVNQFVSYHLVPFKEPYNWLVRHGDEIGFNTDLPDVLPMDLWTYFHTMGKPNRLFKITHRAKDGLYYINRKAYYNNAFDGDMKETSVAEPGIILHPDNGEYDNNALNGYYWPIDHILLYTDYTRDVVLNERIRYNIAQYFPEMMSNDLRTGITKSTHYYLPHKPYKYIDNLLNDEHNCDTDYRTPINAGNTGWAGIESDQFAFSNYFDATLKLMPVPVAGTYEVRWFVSQIASRGIAQGYFGTNPQNLVATGIPFDLRLLGGNPKIGSVTDIVLGYDSVLCIENDRLMRNHHYMKACRTYCKNYFGQAHTWAQSLRNRAESLRLLVYRGWMEPDKTYWLRMKTMLNNATAECFADAIEIVPKSVYDNPERTEDVW